MRQRRKRRWTAQFEYLVNGFNDGYAVTGSTSISGVQDYLTNVGSYTAAGSYYGTFDQAGNVWEWNESLFSGNRGRRGGSWIEANAANLSASAQNAGVPTGEFGNHGFRLALVPEPATGGLFLLLAAGALRPRRPSRFG